MKEDASDAAISYYEYGHLSALRSSSYTSLRTLAKDPSWKNNPLSTKFQSYHGDDPNFADTMIMDALRAFAPFHTISSDQLADVVVRSLQTLVLLPAGVGYMYKAFLDDNCAFTYWDKGAAYLIGSVEGSQWGGDEGDNGVSSFGLAKELCAEFSVCTISGNAETNDRLIQYFKDGEDLISGGTCADLDRYINVKVFPTLLIPLIQGSIAFALADNPKARGSAHVLALAVLPIVHEVDATSANAIKQNSRLDAAGSSTVLINAFSNVLGGMGVNCFSVGAQSGTEISEFGLCKDTYDPGQSTDLSDGLYITRTRVEDR